MFSSSFYIFSGFSGFFIVEKQALRSIGDSKLRVNRVFVWLGGCVSCDGLVICCILLLCVLEIDASR